MPRRRTLLAGAAPPASTKSSRPVPMAHAARFACAAAPGTTSLWRMRRSACRATLVSTWRTARRKAAPSAPRASGRTEAWQRAGYVPLGAGVRLVGRRRRSAMVPARLGSGVAPVTQVLAAEATVPLAGTASLQSKWSARLRQRAPYSASSVSSRGLGRRSARRAPLASSSSMTQLVLAPPAQLAGLPHSRTRGQRAAASAQRARGRSTGRRAASNAERLRAPRQLRRWRQ